MIYKVMPNENSMGKKIVSGVAWSYAERILAQGVSFAISIILARMLDPEHYGVIAIVTIFINICNVFVASGLGSSLIQKKDADSIDFSTAFHAGIFISILLYGILYMVAPVIAEFYGMEQLTMLIRVLGLRLPIAAVNTVQHSYVSKHLIFKKFFFSTLFGTIISAVVGVLLAYSGAGVWALVGQYMTNTIIDTIVLFVILPWKPKLQFSFLRFKSLYSYGWKILVSDLIQALYNELRGLAIGKKYSSSDLAYYNRGQQLTNVIVTNIDSVMNKVLFPAMALQQNDIVSIRGMTRRAIRLSSFFMSPLLIGLAVVAEQVIIVLLTDKWISAVPYLQILCLANLFQPMHSANLQAIKAIGRSDITLKLEIIKKTYSIIILIISITLFQTPFAVAVGFVLSTFISVFVNSFPNKKLLDYGYAQQLQDIARHILLSVLMGVIVYLLGSLNLPVILVLTIQVLAGGSIYIGLSMLLHIESLAYVIDMMKQILKRKNS